MILMASLAIVAAVDFADDYGSPQTRGYMLGFIALEGHDNCEVMFAAAQTSPVRRIATIRRRRVIGVEHTYQAF
jgi:hypothetical protein